MRGHPLLFVVVGVAVLSAVIVAVGPQRVLHGLQGVNVPRFLLGAALLIVVWALRILRWSVLLKAVGDRLSAGGLVTGYFMGAAAGTLTPARLGELSASGIVGTAGGVGSAEGASVIALDRALDLMFLAAGAAAGGAYLHVQGLGRGWVGGVVATVVVVLALVASALAAAVYGWAGLGRMAGSIARRTAGIEKLRWLCRLADSAAREWLPRLWESAARIRSRRKLWLLLLCLGGVTLTVHVTTYCCMVTAALQAPWLVVFASALLAFGGAQASGVPGGAGVGVATFVAAASAAGCDGGQAAAGAVVAGAFETTFLWSVAWVCLLLRVGSLQRLSRRQRPSWQSGAAPTPSEGSSDVLER